MWVYNIEATEPTEPIGYLITGCVSLGGAPYVCTGTLKCSFFTDEGPVSVYFENVMCQTKGDRCPAPSDCLFDGGLLRDFTGGYGVYRPSDKASERSYPKIAPIDEVK